MWKFFTNAFVLFLLIPATGYASEKIILNAEDGWYPFSGVIDEKLQGFAVDIIDAAYKKVGIEVVFEQKPYARCIKEVSDGKVLGCFDTVKQDDNVNDYLWHKKPMFQESLKIWARIDSKESNLSPKDLEGKSVGATIGYQYSDAIDKNPKITKTEAPSDESLLKMLANGRVDYGLIYERVGYAMIQMDSQLKGKLKVVGDVMVTDLYIAFSKKFPNSQKYIKMFEDGYDKIVEDGTFKSLEDKWIKKVGIRSYN